MRTGQYINLFDDDITYDAYVIFAECADELTENDVDRIEEILTPILKDDVLTKSEKESICDKALQKIEDEIEALSWGFNVVIVR